MSDAIVFLRDRSAPFHEMVRFFALQNFCDLAKRDGSQVVDHPVPNDYVYGSHITYIQVMGDSFVLKLKNHFNLEDAGSVIDFAGELSIDEKKKLLLDFFSELNNIIAGKISEFLNKEIGIGTGTSFPVILNGVDEVLSSEAVKASTCFDYFIISGKGFEFVYTLSLDATDEVLNSLKFDASKFAFSNNEMEFL